MTIFTKKEVEKQDMYADSNEVMVVKLIILVGQVGEKEPLESSPRLELIFFSKFSIQIWYRLVYFMVFSSQRSVKPIA